MSKLSYALMLVLCMGFTVSSCKKIDEDLKEDETKTVEITSITATLSPITKTELEDGYKVLWSPGDKISIFVGNESASFISTNTEPAATADFSGSLYIPYSDSPSFAPQSHVYYGVYPYSEQTTMVDGVVKTPLSSEQIAVAGSFADDLAIAVGHSSNQTMSFNNVCGLFEFTLGREDVTQVSFRANNDQALAGMLSIDTDAVATVDGSGAKTVTLSAPEGTYFLKDTPYYFVLAPAVLPDGFTLNFTTDAGILTKQISKSVEIKRSVIGYMTEVDKGAEPAYVPFADPLFKAYCVENFDADGDGEISFEEALDIESIYFVTTEDSPRASSLSGIEYFSNLVSLDFSGQNVESIDLSQNTKLVFLNCPSNPLSSLDVSNNTALKTLNVSGSDIASLDVSNHSALTSLGASMCSSLTTINASNTPALKTFSSPLCPALSSIDITNTPQLESFEASDCSLSSLDFSGHSIVTYFAVSGNQLTSLDLSNCNSNNPDSGNSIVNCSNNQLTSLIMDDSSFGNIDCSKNQLASLDLRTVELVSLDCTDNPLEYIDVPYGFSVSSLSLPEGAQLRYPGGGNQDYSREDWGDLTSCVIYYTSTDGTTVTPYATNVFGANIVSNDYIDGQGRLTFDGEVTTIGENAFSGCSNLASISLPEGVMTIGANAFVNCSSLSEITLPSSLTSVNRDALLHGAFDGCSALTKVNIPNINTWMNLVQNSPIFGSSKEGHLFINGEEVTEIVVPDGVTEISAWITSYCNNIGSISLNSQVQSFNMSNIEGQENLVINVPSVEYWINISHPTSSVYLFDGRPSGGWTLAVNGAAVENLTISSIPTNSSNLVFCGCISLKHVTFTEGSGLGAYTFSGCSNLTSIDFPGNVGVGYYSLSGCPKLESINCPEGFTISIGYGGLSGCIALASIPPVVGIATDGLRGCTGFAAIDLTQCTSIADRGLSDCTGLTSVQLDCLELIGDFAFMGCSGLTSITINRTTVPGGYHYSGMFNDTNNCPIYVPAESVDAYREAWSAYADRISPIDTP